MATRQYIGARYVPKFANPIAWDKANSYEALTIVTYLNNSYTSKKPVPANTEITDTDYWVVTGNYNAQVEEYRKECTNIKAEIENNKVVNYITFGGISDNISFDNGAKLVEAITYCANNNLSLYIPQGKYYCSTQIDLSNIELNAISIYGQYNGGTATYQKGTSIIDNRTKKTTPLLNFGKLNTVIINNIEIFSEGEGDIGIIFNDEVLNTILDNVVMYNYKTSFRVLRHTGYLYFNNCRFDASTNTTNIIELGSTGEIQSGIDYNVEYVYFNNCQIEGRPATNASGIMIYSGTHIYISNTDICNCKNIGINCYLTNGRYINNISSNNLSLTNNHIQVKLDSSNSTSYLYAFDINANFKRADSNLSADDKILLAIGNSTRKITDITFSGKCYSYYNYTQPAPTSCIDLTNCELCSFNFIENISYSLTDCSNIHLLGYSSHYYRAKQNGFVRERCNNMGRISGYVVLANDVEKGEPIATTNVLPNSETNIVFYAGGTNKFGTISTNGNITCDEKLIKNTYCFFDSTYFSDIN